MGKNKVVRAVERAVPLGLYELIEATGLAKPYEWHIEMRCGVTSAITTLGREVWRVTHTPQSQPAPAWQVTRAGVTIGGADSALDALAMILVKHREELDRWRRLVGDALASVSLRITEGLDDEGGGVVKFTTPPPEVRREPQGAPRRNSETALAPEPNSPPDVGYLDKEAHHEQLLEQLTWLLNGAALDAQTRGMVEAEIRRTNAVTRMEELDIDALTKLTVWLAKHKAGEARALAIKQRLAGKDQR